MLAPQSPCQIVGAHPRVRPVRMALCKCRADTWVCPYIKKPFYRTKHAHDDAINPLIVDYVFLFNRPQNPLYRHRSALRGVFANQGFLVRHFRKHAIQGFIQHIGF